jgi:hypothetical protein
MAKKKITVKDVNFDTVKNICADFKDATGLYDPSKNTIYLHKNLPKQTRWPRCMILAHEKAHAKMAAAGIKLPAWNTEAICDLLAIVQTSEKFMSHAEMTARRSLLDNGRYSWRRMDDREAIAVRILQSVQILPSRPAINMLAGIFPKAGDKFEK